MSIEFIGIASTSAGSEAQGYSGPAVDPAYLALLVRTHEDAGFDRVLVAHSSAMPDGFTVADQILSRTTTLKVLLAHRPGFVAPTIAARKYATIDAFHPGRIALHVITGGDDADQARDGDISDKVTRYRRTDEFLDILRREWESETPFDYAGEFYQVRGGFSSVRPPAGTDPGLLRRGVGGGGAGRRQARRRVRVLGRAARRDHRADRAGAGSRGTVWARHPVQREPAAHPRRHRAGRLGPRR